MKRGTLRSQQSSVGGALSPKTSIEGQPAIKAAIAG